MDLVWGILCWVGRGSVNTPAVYESLDNTPVLCNTGPMRKDKVRQVQELRRSNAAQPHRNRKKYTRKLKHRKNNENR
jgi:hypothetical protein